jgi:tRNA1(Val) A37 N6-methylase TrmN6
MERNNNSREILEGIIKKFSTEQFIHFFRSKNTSFRNRKLQEDLSNYNDGDFTSGEKIGEIEFRDNKLIVCAFRILKELTERSGKKKQYELGKRILRETNTDAGIFIFYDQNGNFRFSLIYTDYLGTRRSFSYFKRFTYYVSPSLTNRTFLDQISAADFSSLDKIKEAFSVEPVTKQFYDEIQNWYFWAMDKVRFPEDYKYASDRNKDKEIRNATNLIRLITRIIFIWFIKEKGLIPEELFDRDRLKDIVKDFNRPRGHNYYNAILQNLFFASLNSKMDERGWAKDEGYPKNITTYGVKNLYRYEDKFLIGEEEILNLFKEIPFLNGGLFDCLDKEDKSGSVIYIDGFSRRPHKQAIIPDDLFFQQDEIRLDLSEYGLGSNKPVRGLIEILKSYNFTIDENTPVDQEVALDPELLGKVFENLLASYNPETATTARKATGSYYTPREIVDYMVEESLREYLKTKLPDIGEDKLDILLSYSEEVPDFSDEEKQKIISAIDGVKIIDPACGSGAFPMGILHKLVYILQKIDPDNKQWRELQYQKALKSAEQVFKEKDKLEREEMLKEINEAFDENINYPDYARKLYLIENCIYGVDIQSIAIQISKLRFFISLILDQKVDKTKENYGIRALPNLETKFVAANTLIGLVVPRIDLFSKNDQMNKLQKELKNLRHKYFTAKTRKQKLSLQRGDKEIRDQMSELLKKNLTVDIQKEIEQLENRIRHEEDILFDIEHGSEEKEIIEINTLFGKEERIIDKKKGRIKLQRREINELKKSLGKLKNIKEQQINEQADKIASFDLFDQNGSADWFDPEWMFGVNDGFDIVIGNPPYIQLQKAANPKQRYADFYKDQGYEAFDRMGDIYCLFYEKGIKLLKPNGILAYITSNKWMRAKYGQKLKKFFIAYNPKILIDLGPNVFKCNNPEGPTVDTCIILVERCANQDNLISADLTNEISKNCKEVLSNLKKYVNSKEIIVNKLSENAWFIGSNAEQRLKEKIERIGRPLREWDVNIYRGVLTGLNEAFIIDTKKRDEILSNCKSRDERKRTEEIIKPILRGRDIKRYYYEWAGLWVIVIPAGWTNENRGADKPAIFIENSFPSLMQYLKQFETRAKKRDDQGDYWWELRACAYYPEFEKEKVVYSETIKIYFDGTRNYPRFCYDDAQLFLDKTTFFISGLNNKKYLLAFLNSKVSEYLLENGYCIKLGSGSRGLQKILIEKLPIPNITPSNEPIVKQIETIVDQILSTKKQNPEADTSELEKEIDRLVYRLYNLTEVEIEIIQRS